MNGAAPIMQGRCAQPVAAPPPRQAPTKWGGWRQGQGRGGAQRPWPPRRSTLRREALHPPTTRA